MCVLSVTSIRLDQRRCCSVTSKWKKWNAKVQLFSHEMFAVYDCSKSSCIKRTEFAVSHTYSFRFSKGWCTCTYIHDSFGPCWSTSTHTHHLSIYLCRCKWISASVRHILRKNKWKNEGINNEKRRSRFDSEFVGRARFEYSFQKQNPIWVTTTQCNVFCLESIDQLLAPDRATLIGCIRMIDGRPCAVVLFFCIFLYDCCWIADKQYKG